MHLPRKLILKNFQSPGDIVMLTAAVRDLHKTYPDQFLTDVRTSCAELWANNPYLTPLDEDEQGVETIFCKYPLVKFANQWPYHFLHGFIHYLNGQLKLAIRPWHIKGDIHLSDEEWTCKSLVENAIGTDVPYWIVVAGGKSDYTVKWWQTERFQAVIDHFRGRLLFVQVGLEHHHHPPLKNVLSLVGKTSLRDLVHLVHCSDGVLSPVTAAMHLAAAVPLRSRERRLRPCVVVAGGREPHHWESYPGHQFLHTIGALDCCALGGCWKARTTALGDGHEFDEADYLCSQAVSENLPRCMDLITPNDVVRRIESYFEGGTSEYLTPGQQQTINRAKIWR